MEKEWYYLTDNEEQAGPFTFEEICSKLENNEISANTRIKKDTEFDWILANEHQDFTFIAEEKRNPEILINQVREEKYRKVGGWLLLFCIGVGILTPIFNFYYLFQALEMFFTYDLENNVKAYLLTNALFMISFIVLSIITGYKLFRIVPGAVTFTYIFLIIACLLNLLLSILPYMFSLEDGLANQISKEGMGDTFKAFVYGIIWCAYFYKSKRVNYTYSLGRY